MHSALIPPSEINTDQLPSMGDANVQARHNRTAAVVIEECGTESQEKLARPQVITLNDTLGVCGAKQCPNVISSKKLGTTDEDYSVPVNMLHERSTFDHINGKIEDNFMNPGLVNMSSKDRKRKKYKSLNTDTMNGYPVYEALRYVRPNAEENEDAEKEYINGHFDRRNWFGDDVHCAGMYQKSDEMGADRAMRESVDGEYVLPDEVIRSMSTSPTNKELAARL